MTRNRKFRPSPAMAISCIALFVALTGTAFAAPKLAVRSAQIVDATIRTVDLRDEAVKSAKVANGTLTADDLGTDSVNSDEIAENAVASPEVAPDSLGTGDLGTASVASSEVADQALTQDDLGPDSVGSSEIQTGAVRASELGTIIQVSKQHGDSSRRQRRRHRHLPGRDDGDQRRRPSRPLPGPPDLVLPQRQRLARRRPQRRRGRHHPDGIRLLPHRRQQQLTKVQRSNDGRGQAPRPLC